MNIVAKPVPGDESLCAVGIRVSVPVPKLFLWTKFNSVKVWARPASGTYTPSSKSLIPSCVRLGGVACHLIPYASLFNQ